MTGNIGTRIAERRETLGLSISDLATTLRIHPEYLQQIEDGRWQNPRDILPKLARVLKTTVPDLLDYPEVHPVDPEPKVGNDMPTEIIKGANAAKPQWQEDGRGALAPRRLRRLATSACKMTQAVFTV